MSTSHPPPRDVLAQMTPEEKITLLSGSALMRTSGIPRLGLHPAKVTDSPMGINGDGLIVGPSTTVVPNATALAATWDLDLVRSVGRLLGSEARWKEADVYLAPTLNLHRDPRGGRNQESFGEDGYLAGKVGAAFVSGVHEQGIAVCAKHLVCNESETDRKDYNVVVDEQTLRQVYLRPFEILVREASPRTIMTSYNKLNGTAASENEQLLRLVRDEWKWDGMFMSDWSGTYDGVASLKAGLDLEMPFPQTRGPKLLEAIKAGTLTEADLDVSCERIIKLLQELSPPSAAQRTVPDRPSPLLPETAALVRRASAEAVILIRNNGILPLDPAPSVKKTLAVVGPLATARNISHLLIPAYLVKPLDGIRAAVAEASGSGSGQNLKVAHSDGVYVHRCIPKLDQRFSTDIQFRLWAGEDRTVASAERAEPYATRRASEAVEAYVTSPVPLATYEIEMTATIAVPTSGTYILSVISGHTAQVYVDNVKIYDYAPEGKVGMARFLFEMHDLERTFTHNFDAERSYVLCVVTQSHPVGSIAVPGQGLMVGMVLDVSRETLIADAVRTAQSADVACVFVGTTHEWEMEGVDRTDIQLPCDQAELVRAVLAVQPNTVVINQSGGAVDLSCADEAAAILHAHVSGQGAGHAIADVLFGKVNPSGKSPFTWPKRLEDCPTAELFPRNKQDMSLVYSERLSNGYAGYLERGTTPAVSFGHGLSYTTFEIGGVSLSGRLGDTSTVGSRVEVSATVRNTGRVAGRHVIQVYVRHPSGRPTKSLEGFAKTALLDPGAAETVTVSLDRRSFAAWDPVNHEWRVGEGFYGIEVANSAEDVVCNLSLAVESNLTWRGL